MNIMRFTIFIYLSEFAVGEVAVEPLYLSSFIENGQFNVAKEKSLVKHEEMKNITSYSGFITVNKTYNSNVFFWFFPSQVIIYIKSYFHNMTKLYAHYTIIIKFF